MSGSKYIVYKCDVCDRQTEIQLDGKRPDPSRCNITLNCRGKLQRLGERSVREFLFTPIVPGLPDYIQRGTPIIPAPQLTVPNPITVFTASGSGIIALSAVRRSVSGPNANFYVKDDTNANFILETISSTYDEPLSSTVKMVLFEISPELLTSTKYTYTINGPVQIVSGPDNSPEGKNLRFTTTNQLSVYVNGVVLDPIYYDRSVDNQITFTPTIYDTNNVVEIFVYKDISAAINNSKQVTLTFRPLVSTIPGDLALRNLDCWGNFAATIINNVERFTLFCTDLTQLSTDKSYGVAYFEATNANGTQTRQLNPDEVFILLGREPFSFRDKEYYAYLTGTSLVTNQSVMTYKESAASGSLFLTVDETAITQVFNQIKLSRRIADASNVSSTVAGTALEGTEKLTPKYIIGPV